MHKKNSVKKINIFFLVCCLSLLFCTDTNVRANETATQEPIQQSEPIGDYADEQDGFSNAEDADADCPITIKAYVMDECQDARYSAYITFLAEDGIEYSFQLTKTNEYKKNVKLPAGTYVAFGGICSDNRRMYQLFTYMESFDISSDKPVYFDCLIGDREWIAENKSKLNAYEAEDDTDSLTKTEESSTEMNIDFKESSNGPDDERDASVPDLKKPFALCIVLIAIIIALSFIRKKRL